MSFIDHVESVAKKKIGVEGWEPYAWEKIGTDGMLVTGGVPKILQSGPRKGEKTWDRKGDQVVVVQSEVDCEFDIYEKGTGRCGRCMGEGKTICKISVANGTEYKPCDRCKGVGTAPDREPLIDQDKEKEAEKISRAAGFIA